LIIFTHLPVKSSVWEFYKKLSNGRLKPILQTFDKLVIALETSAEELFATNKMKEPQELIKKINQNIAIIGDDSDKLEIILNLTNSLIKVGSNS